jgi:hypothetical protein
LVPPAEDSHRGTVGDVPNRLARLSG